MRAWWNRLSEGRRIVLASLFLAFVAIPAVMLAAAPPGVGAAADERDLVVVVHGMGRSRVSMAVLAHALEEEGYRVVNWGYSSTSDSIPALAAALAARVERDARGARVHFVGHSLGNILVRWTVAHRPPERLGRVVMLAPPNQGSKEADRFAPWIGWLLRPIEGLTTADTSVARTIGAARGVEVGIIAGRYDGKVSVEEARLPGARDFTVVPSAHTFIMDRRDVRRLTVRFLRTGRFAPRSAAAR